MAKAGDKIWSYVPKMSFEFTIVVLSANLGWSEGTKARELFILNADYFPNIRELLRIPGLEN